MIMAVFDHSSTFQRWCAAVFSDYEIVLNQFFIADGWDFETFKKWFGDCRTALLHHCAVGQGKGMNVQYERITRILIQTAKDFWLLYPMNEFINHAVSEDKDNAFIDSPVSNSRLKSMIGGFYLTYSMFETATTQKTRKKVLIDPQDLLAFYYFKKCLAENPVSDSVKLQIVHMLFQLTSSDAFEICSESRQCGINPEIRHYRNIVDSNLSKMIHAVKDSQNNFVLPFRSGEVIDEVQKIEASKAKIKQMAMMACSALTEFDALRVSNISATAKNSEGQNISEADNTLVFHGHSTVEDGPGKDKGTRRNESQVRGAAALKESLNLDANAKLSQVVNISSLCSVLNDTPILSVPNMLANVIVDRAMMSESRKRAERSSKKPKLTGGSGIEGESYEPRSTESTRVRQSRPYIDEGGIFGYKSVTKDKVRDEETNFSSTETSDSAKNLWDYINTGVFGGLGMTASTSAAASTSSDDSVGAKGKDYQMAATEGRTRPGGPGPTSIASTRTRAKSKAK